MQIALDMLWGKLFFLNSLPKLSDSLALTLSLSHTHTHTLDSLCFDVGPRVVGLAPSPEVSLLPESAQAPVQVHALLVGRGSMAVSGAGTLLCLDTTQQGPHAGV